MKSPRYKVGQVLMRVKSPYRNDTFQDIFETGVMLEITKITKAMYFYNYLNLRPGQKGNTKFEEIESTCIISTEVGKLLYG